MKIFEGEILFFKLERKKMIKTEFKKTILKSIYKNMGCNEYIRIQAYLKLRKSNKNRRLSKQHNTCLLSGKHKGIHNPFNLSRHWIKRLAKENRLTNLKIKSW